jgi:hypothetical protein
MLQLRKSLVTLALAFSLLGQVVFPLSASAGNLPLDYDHPNAGGVNTNYKVSFNVITPQVLTSVVSCTGVQNLIAKKLITVTDAVQKEADKLLQNAKDQIAKLFTDKLKRKAKEKLAEEARSTLVKAASVTGAAASTTAFGSGLPGAAVGIVGAVTDIPHPSTTKTDDTDTQKKIDESDQKKIDADAANKKDQRVTTCINGIAIQLAKNQLTSMTRYTMNWINSGFNGDPLYVQDVNSFMNSLTDEIVQKESDFFKNADKGKYPFGRDFARSSIAARQTEKNFNASLQQDLTDYLDPESTVLDFSNDFSVGGWDGWLALTTHPQNNPLGFTMLNANHLAEEQNKTIQQTTDQINRDQGYLDQKKCVLWQVYSQDAQPQYNDDGSEETTTKPGKLDKCLKWATTLPGSNIKEKTDTYLNTSERQLELVKTMDDALNALFASLLNRYSTQGLPGLSTPGANSFVSGGQGGPGSNGIYDAYGNSLTGSGFSSSSLSSPASDGYFDLLHDLGNTYTYGTHTIEKRGVLQHQQDYIDNAQEFLTASPQSIEKLGELDYCIPGPNPAWKDIAQSSINDYLDSISLSDKNPIEPDVLAKELDDYTNTVEKTYGDGSPLQTPSNAAYLKMSRDGLLLTANLAADNDTAGEASDAYKSGITETKVNLAKLVVIKNKVNSIIAAAQARRAAERVKNKLPAIKTACLDSERVTYVVDGEIK